MGIMTAAAWIRFWLSWAYDLYYGGQTTDDMCAELYWLDGQRAITD